MVENGMAVFETRYVAVDVEITVGEMAIAIVLMVEVDAIVALVVVDVVEKGTVVTKTSWKMLK